MHMQQQQQQHDPILFTQSQIEACLLRGLSKWEIVTELQTLHQLKQHVILDVWAKLESQNQTFFSSYEQFIKLRNQLQDFNDVVQKLFNDSNDNHNNNGASDDSRRYLSSLNTHSQSQHQQQLVSPTQGGASKEDLLQQRFSPPMFQYGQRKDSEISESLG